MTYQEINKQNIGKWIETLKYLTKILDSNHISYYLSASGLDYIQGSNIYPYDIDLFVSKENIKQVFTLLKEISTSNLHQWEDRYLEFQGEYNGIPFEICEWEKEPEKIEMVDFKDLKICKID